MSDSTDLGDRMKFLEGRFKHRFSSLSPVVVRVDGKNFSGLTRGMNKPFDHRFKQCMEETAMKLLEDSGAAISYTQSDEISLVFATKSVNEEIWFGGKQQKLVSILASKASIYFASEFKEYFGHEPLAVFDARAFDLPTFSEASNYLLWRELDAARNAISMAARSMFSHNECMNKSTTQLVNMMAGKGVNFSEKYDSKDKYGSYFKKVKITRKFTQEELSKLPEKHDARQNPDLEIERTELKRLDIAPIREKNNRTEVLFGDVIEAREDL